ncbi:MAG: flagellar biosynthesis protein FlhB [Syntrophomonas sp.]|nr:flagellar biosynthesis protein FlhB [Syntrophomonas sp.]
MDYWKYYSINLQLFADDEGSGEKTETATPRRREEARKKGQVFKSTDLNAAVILIAGSTVGILSFGYMTANLEQFTILYLLDRTQIDFDNAYAYKLLYESVILIGKMVFPILLTSFITALAITYLQVGALFSTEVLTPKIERLNPVEGFKKIFSKRSFMELTKSLLKIGLTSYIVYTVLRKYLYVFPRFVDMDIIASMVICGSIILEIALKVGVFFVVIGVIDYIFQWFEHEKSLKMSKYDVKQEYKQVEGDPQIKSKQRQIQREVAMRRMMAEVPTADVVITNPTHFAVALRYQAESMDAPTIIAKGQDFLALKIREIAELNKVTVVENPPLARTLFYTTELGQIVPEDLYQAVAEVLAFVYKQKKQAL